MSTCSKCGTDYARNVRICPRDGTVLETAGGPDPRLTQVLDGKYRIDASLGQGGMGTIYSATHLMLGKTVAVKLINPELTTSPDVVRRFQREARAASHLTHPNIAAAYDLGQTEDGTLYIAMELVRGSSLKQVIRSTGRLDDARIIRILRQVTSALSLAHKNKIIHRDLKPHNIMLTTDADGREVAKLLDFGIAKTFDDAATQLTATGFALGTPQYMAPEQALGKPVDGRTDLYSLGIILYEMLTGEVPFNDPSTPAVLVKHMTEPPTWPSRRRPDLSISPVLEGIALRCLEKDPAARFQTADELADALEPASGLDAATARINLTRLPPMAAVADVPTAAFAETAPTVVLPPAGSAASTESTGGATTVQSTMPATAPTIIPATAPTIIPATAPTIIPAAKPAPPATPTAPLSALAVAAAVGGAAAAVPAAPLPAPPAASAPPMPFVAASRAADPVGSVQPAPRRVIGGPVVLVALLILLIAAAGFAVAYARGYLSSSTRASNPSTSQPTPPPPPPASPPPATPPGLAAEQAAAVASPPEASGSVPVSGRAASGVRATRPPVSARASSRAAGAAAPIAAQAIEHPSVLFRCAGVALVCAALRSAMDQALESDSMPSVRDAARAAIVVDAKATEVDARADQMFGTVFVVRTYSVELDGTQGRDTSVPMPAPTTFSFDARVGQEKLDQQARLIAASAVEKVRAFWKKRLPPA